MENADFLSFSPSLLDVLSYLDYRDIGSCSLTDRRIHDVIERNRNGLKKPPADITISPFICLCTDEDDLCLSVNISTSYPSEHQTTVSISPDDIKYDKHRGLNEYYEGERPHYLSEFPGSLNGLQRSLTELISLIVTRYSIKTLDMSQLTRPDTFDQISQVFILLRIPKVHQLNVDVTCDGIRALSDHLDAEYLHVDVGKLMLAEAFSDIPVLSQRNIKIMLNQNRDDDEVDTIVELIKEWQDSSDRLEMQITRKNTGKRSWMHIPWILLSAGIKFEMIEFEDCYRKMKISRPGDTKQLTLLAISASANSLLVLSQDPIWD